MTDERRRSLLRVRSERLGHSMGAMRARIALGLAVLATAIGLVIDMSASAPRLAGDDHVSWAPVLGGLLVVLALAHGLFAETLTISRYYG